MKLNQKLNGLDVIMSCKETDVSTLVMMERKVGEYTEYVIGSTRDGETWSFGQYFNAQDYGGKPDAYAAAHLQFIYRSGLTADINRAARSKRVNVQRLLIDLRIVPDRREARLRAQANVV